MSLLGDWFNKISAKLGEKLQDNSNAKGSADASVKEVTKIENKKVLQQSIVCTLKRVVENKDSLVGKQLVIWLDCDQITFDNYNTDSFRLQILSALSNECGFNFDNVSFSIGKPSKKLRATIIGANELEYLQVLNTKSTTDTNRCKAKITIFGNAGSLIEKQYILSPYNMKKKNITYYNIGAGQFSQTQSGYRENHIAIDDNPLSPEVEKNKYVSRSHAHIGFSDKLGFYFQVEKDGTRLMGKRTRIFREDEKIECDDPLVKIPLQSGDLIELGKAVVLKYELLN